MILLVWELQLSNIECIDGNITLPLPNATAWVQLLLPQVLTMNNFKTEEKRSENPCLIELF